MKYTAKIKQTKKQNKKVLAIPLGMHFKLAQTLMSFVFCHKFWFLTRACFHDGNDNVWGPKFVMGNPRKIYSLIEIMSC